MENKIKYAKRNLKKFRREKEGMIRRKRGEIENKKKVYEILKL